MKHIRAGRKFRELTPNTAFKTKKLRPRELKDFSEVT